MSLVVFRFHAPPPPIACNGEKRAESASGAAIGKGNRHFKIVSLYGFDGASGDGERFSLNEDLIGRAL